MADTAGIGGNNMMYVTLEDPYGTYIDPSDGDGAWVPFIEESLVYTEPKYYSKQIRNQTMDSEVKPSYYHVEGDIKMEVDAHYLPYFLYASRHAVVETDAGTPFLYSATPASFGSTYPGGSAYGVSITIIRNGEGFGYSGCVVGQWVFTIENGVAMMTLSIIGLGEEEPADLDTETYVAPSLFGADAHTIFVDASGATPTFASADDTFNGFTATFNYNAKPENRIRPDRRASFVSYGETEYTYNTELDFLDRTEYDAMVASETRALRYQSIKPGGADGTWAAATEGIRITMRRSNYDTYVVNTPAIGDLIMAQVTGHGLVQNGADAFTIECLSTIYLGFIAGP